MGQPQVLLKESTRIASNFTERQKLMKAVNLFQAYSRTVLFHYVTVF